MTLQLVRPVEDDTRPFDFSRVRVWRYDGGGHVILGALQLELDVEGDEDDDDEIVNNGCGCPSCRDTNEYGYGRDDDEDDEERLVTLDTFTWGGGVRTEHASALLMLHGTDTELGVWSVKVDEDFRGQGYGRQLMHHICRMADWHNYSLSLQVYADNTPAIRLYESVGFVMTDQGSSSCHVMRRPDRQLCLVAA